MQHKRRRSKWVIVLVVLLALAGGAAFFLTGDVPAPSQPVEKQIDAKIFLEPKQP